MLKLEIEAPVKNGITYNTPETDKFLSDLVQQYGCIAVVYNKVGNISVEVAVDCKVDETKCKCGNLGDIALHPCPYSQDIDGDNREVCNCCADCVNTCADDI